jgi:hypothetical protein
LTFPLLSLTLIPVSHLLRLIGVEELVPLVKSIHHSHPEVLHLFDLLPTEHLLPTPLVESPLLLKLPVLLFSLPPPEA